MAVFSNFSFVARSQMAKRKQYLKFNKQEGILGQFSPVVILVQPRSSSQDLVLSVDSPFFLSFIKNVKLFQIPLLTSLSDYL